MSWKELQMRLHELLALAMESFHFDSFQENKEDSNDIVAIATCFVRKQHQGSTVTLQSMYHNFSRDIRSGTLHMLQR